MNLQKKADKLKTIPYNHQDPSRISNTHRYQRSLQSFRLEYMRVLHPPLSCLPLLSASTCKHRLDNLGRGSVYSSHAK